MGSYPTLFTLACSRSRESSAVWSLRHFPSRNCLRAQALPGGLPIGARTFLARTPERPLATVRPVRTHKDNGSEGELLAPRISHLVTQSRAFFRFRIIPLHFAAPQRHSYSFLHEGRMRPSRSYE